MSYAQSRVTVSFSSTNIAGWPWVTIWEILDPERKSTIIKSGNKCDKVILFHTLLPLLPRIPIRYCLDPPPKPGLIKEAHSHLGHLYLATLKPPSPSEGWKATSFISSPGLKYLLLQDSAVRGDSHRGRDETLGCVLLMT